MSDEPPKQQPDDDQQDFSEPLDPADAVVGAAEPEQEPEQPQHSQPLPQLLAALPAETPSTSNNALIMQIKILSEYANDIKRTMNAVATAAGVHHEYVRRAVSNLVTAVVEHNGDIVVLQQIYSEGNYPLKPKELHRLLILVDNLLNRNQNPEDFNDNGSQQNRRHEDSINRNYNNNTRNNRMMRNNDYYGGYGPQQQQPQQQPQPQEEEIIDLSTNAQLLKEVLQNQKNASPTNIQKTLRLFMLDEATFINQPNDLYALLQSMFNPVTAQGAFNLFMQMRPKYVQQPGGRMPNGSGIPTYNLGDPQYLMQGGADAYAARLAYEERREMLEDRRFDKYMRNMMMVNMQKMMGAQTPMIGDPGMYGGMGAVKEEFDEKTGKVTGRSFVPGAVGGGMSDGMLRVIGEQNKILLQSQMDQLREMKDMFTSVLKNSQNNQNPLAVIEQFKNAGLIPDPAKASQAAPESIETINARLDAQVKLLTIKMEMEKTRHDWNIQREDKIAQSENTKERVGTIKDIIEHSVKPTLGEFAKGYGEAMARQKWEAEQQKMAAVQQRRARMAAMNRQQMGGGIPPQQQQHQQQQQQQQFYRQQQQAQQQQMPPQQQHQQPYPPQEQRPSRHQQEMQRNIINEEKIAQMSMEEIPSCRGQSISRTWWTQTW